ncbi:isochorismate synthase [Thiolapillus sp.]
MAQKVDKLQPIPVWLGRLRLELRQLAEPALSGKQKGMLSIAFEAPVPELSAPPGNASSWMYWHRPDSNHRLLGLGLAYSLRARGSRRFEQLDVAYKKLQAGWTRITQGRGRARARAFLGFAFDPEFRPTRDWSGFDNAGLYLPQLLFEWKNHRCVLTFSCFRDQDTRADEVIGSWIKQLQSALSANDAVPVASSACLKTEQPAESAWRDDVAAAVAVMQRQRGLEKVVLTRQLQLRFKDAIPHRQMLPSLAQTYPGCTMLSVSFGQGVLLAATPEMLFDMSAEHVHCDALAGTFPADVDQASDQMEVFEHAPVVRAIEAALDPLCTGIQVEKAGQPLALQSLSHLHTFIQGKPKADVRPLAMVQALHPTPAVGGMPGDTAMDWIRDHEQLDRGWYTGAFGWLGDNQEAQMAVILRCALVHDKHARLFAGAGITRVSDPEQELQETRLKLEPMLKALTG